MARAERKEKVKNSSILLYAWHRTVAAYTINEDPGLTLPFCSVRALAMKKCTTLINAGSDTQRLKEKLVGTLCCFLANCYIKLFGGHQNTGESTKITPSLSIKFRA